MPYLTFIYKSLSFFTNRMSVAFFTVVSRYVYFCLNGFHLVRILNFVVSLCGCYIPYNFLVLFVRFRNILGTVWNHSPQFALSHR